MFAVSAFFSMGTLSVESWQDSSCGAHPPLPDHVFLLQSISIAMDGFESMLDHGGLSPCCSHGQSQIACGVALGAHVLSRSVQKKALDTFARTYRWRMGAGVKIA